MAIILSQADRCRKGRLPFVAVAIFMGPVIESNEGRLLEKKIKCTSLTNWISDKLRLKRSTLTSKAIKPL